ncbi:MAG: SIS domain-containing protein [Thermoplasmatales archaeon]|nr:SIS domain-containing protein [Thermoplasmatales archaeon]MCW6169999.1 SIS domain-containing protein [Thermoplasmatales archaeon]
MEMDYAALIKKYLGEFTDLKSVKPIGRRAIVTGSGDAFAAATVIEDASGGRFIAMDPETLLVSDSEIPIIIVSASGRTKEAINVARKFHGKNTLVSVTGNMDSEVSRLSDRTIAIPIESEKMSGVLSFLEMLDALFRLAGLHVEFEDVRSSEHFDHPCFVGSALNFGVAQFLSLKMAEVFGISSEYFRGGQFFHAPIFSMRKREVVFLSSLDHRLENYPVDVFGRIVTSGTNNPFSNTIWGLETIANTMVKNGRKTLYFLDDKEILDISSSAIYG